MDYWMSLTKSERKTAFYNFNEKYKEIVLKCNTPYNEQNVTIKVGRKFWTIAIQSEWSQLTAPMITVKRYERIKKGKKIEKKWAKSVIIGFERAEDDPLRHKPNQTVELDRWFFENFEKISDAQRFVKCRNWKYGTGRGCRESNEML